MHDGTISEADADAAMDRYACGDQRAFETVQAFAEPRLMRFARKKLSNHAAAEDVVQQAMLNMVRARGDFARGAKVMPWAYSITRGVLLDHLRRKRRERLLFERAAAERVPVFAFGPDAQLVANQTATLLRDTFAALPAAQRDALRLRGLGLSLADAARETHTTITAMKLRVHRAIERLRAAFRDERKKPR
jgi:RNA polymerase sigma-70 factor (ECF subfamily)